MITQCLILAGGLATRMRPFTETIPKALIPILGRPFAEHQLTWLAKNGIKKIIYSIGYKGELIQQQLGKGHPWNVDITYCDEGSELKGTGGALRLAYDQHLLDEQFFVLYGDSFLSISFKEVWKAHITSDLAALMTVYKNKEKWDSSNVCYRNGLVILYDKAKKHPPHPQQPLEFIDYGLSILKRFVVPDYIPPRTKIDLAEVFYQLSLQQKLAGFEATERFYEIGSIQGLKDFETAITDGTIPSYT